MTSFYTTEATTDLIAVADAKAASIPRYAAPDADDGPKEGMCYNCGHRVTIELGGTTYHLCVQERDDRKGGQFGDVFECDRDETDCCCWVWDGSSDEWEDVYGVRP